MDFIFQLYVFANNKHAESLYEPIGFQVTRAGNE